jgi:hypothetical protein
MLLVLKNESSASQTLAAIVGALFSTIDKYFSTQFGYALGMFRPQARVTQAVAFWNSLTGNEADVPELDVDDDDDNVDDNDDTDDNKKDDGDDDTGVDMNSLEALVLECCLRFVAFAAENGLPAAVSEKFTVQCFTTRLNRFNLVPATGKAGLQSDLEFFAEIKSECDFQAQQHAQERILVQLSSKAHGYAKNLPQATPENVVSWVNDMHKSLTESSASPAVHAIANKLFPQLKVNVQHEYLQNWLPRCATTATLLGSAIASFGLSGNTEFAEAINVLREAYKVPEGVYENAIAGANTRMNAADVSPNGRPEEGIFGAQTYKKI